ncbi:MAG: ABC transporter ATP-binding protein/permease [Oscillospiraceae bacterium]|nr:ABC transporter ATP-binding protein/permease [Oscillospiraceae bacterium]
MLSKLFPYIEGYKKSAILAPLLVVAEVICELILPRLMSGIIDTGINGDGGFPYILRIGCFMLILAVCSMISGVGSVRFSTHASQGFGYNLRKALFERTQEFSFANIDRFSSASLITRLTNDVNNIQLMVNTSLRMLIRAPIMLLFALIVCFSIHARLTVILIIAVPLMGAAIGLIMRVCHRLFEIFQEKIDGLNNSVQENLIAIRVVKAFVREGYEKTKFARSNDELKEAGIRAVTRVVLLQPVMMVTFNVSTVLALWFGGQYVLGDTLSTGDLYSFLTYIINILMSVMVLAFALLQITRARASADRIVEVLDTVPDIRDSAEYADRALPAAQGRVEFCGVNFKYVSGGTGDDVLHGIDLTIEPGEFVAIVGGTGVGKSSLVNLIPRFYDVTGGAVLVDGMDVRDYPVKALRDRIGMVLQNNVLFSGTIRENLLWGNPDATEEQITQAAQDAQAYDFISRFPDGFDTYIDQGGVNVSGGQKQRLCIARAMLRHPSILILDDSTSAVDSATEAAIRRSFYENLKGTTVIIIAQRISSVRNADKIIVLDDDHIAGIGTHETLLAGNAIYQEIYHSQQEGMVED